MLADYHIHTVLCKHAEGPVVDYVETAAKRGLAEICFTDHIPAPNGYDSGNRMDLAQYPEYVALVKSVQGRTDVAVRLGIEADYYEGCEPFLREWLPQQELDLVLGSVHYIRAWGFDNPTEQTTWDKINVTESWREYFALVGRLADTRLFDVLGHPDLPKKFGHRPSEGDVVEMVGPALDRLAEAGMGFELNTSGLRRPVKEIYPSPVIVRMCRQRGIPVCFGSDAHAPNDVAHRFDLAVALAREAGYTECLRISGRRKRMAPLP